MANIFPVAPLFVTVSVAAGVVVPIPTFPANEAVPLYRVYAPVNLIISLLSRINAQSELDLVPSHV